MPITLKRRQDTNDADTDSADSSPATFTRFVYRSRWFVLAQTEGAELPEPSIPQWDAKQALSTLGVDEIPFDSTDGNVMGYARERSIAINPLNPLPHKTRFHELAHVLLGHTAEEAESVALLCCAALQLPGLDEARGYIQHYWGQGHAIPERSAQQVLKVADAILKSGAVGEVSRCVPHPVPWTHICAMPPGVAHTPRAPRSAFDTQASRDARSGCTAPRRRPRRRGRPRGSERFGRGSLAP